MRMMPEPGEPYMHPDTEPQSRDPEATTHEPGPHSRRNHPRSSLKGSKAGVGPEILFLANCICDAAGPRTTL